MKFVRAISNNLFFFLSIRPYAGCYQCATKIRYDDKSTFNIAQLKSLTLESNITNMNRLRLRITIFLFHLVRFFKIY